MIVHGIPNFSPVDEAQCIYRGGQPVGRDSWEYLKSLGVTSVIKLNTDSEGSAIIASEGCDAFASTALGMQVMLCPITLTQQLLTEPDLNSLSAAVGFIVPGTYVHCGSDSRTQHAFLIGDDTGAGGNDRTGAAVLIYRVKICKWPVKAAWAEALHFDFHCVLLGLDRAIHDLTES